MGGGVPMLQLFCLCSFSLLELPANYNCIFTWHRLFLLGLLPFECKQQVWKGYGQNASESDYEISVSLVIKLYM